MRNKTITVNMDIESTIPWQDSMLKNITGGIHPGEMVLFTAGRQHGKSMLNHYYGMMSAVPAPAIKVLDQAIVDGEKWYTISALRDASIWIRNKHASQENKKWVESIDARWHINFNTFDVHEEFYTLLVLRWS